MQPNNLPPEGWVLKFERDHPRRDEVVAILNELFPDPHWSIAGERDYYAFNGRDLSTNNLNSFLPRLTMNDFLARTVDYKGVKVGEECEVSYDGKRWAGGFWYIGKSKNETAFITERRDGPLYRAKHIRPIQSLTITLSEAESLLSEIKKQVVKIEG